MSLRYLPTSSRPALSQGEIIINLLEVPPLRSDVIQLTDENKSPSVSRLIHPIAVTITQDCDLYWDWKARNIPDQVKKDELDENKLLKNIQFCHMYEYDDIRWSRGLNSTLWERVKSNQDERYHLFSQAPIGDDAGEFLPELYVDFKHVFSLPVDYVYWIISTNFANRKAIVSDPYLRDFIHRLFSYLSRVPIPNDDEATWKEIK